MSKSSHHHDHHGHHSHQHPPAPKHHGGTAPSEGITTQHLRFHYHHRHHHPSALPESSRQVITAAAEINTADADTDLKSGLVINSSIKPFDMIVALSQNSINASLSYLWSKQPKGTPTPGASFSSFNYINISNPKAKTSIVGSLKAPTVQLTVQNGPAREVLFLLAFGDDANFNFVNVDYENEEFIPVSQNLTGWVFAFVVSLDLQAAAIDNLPQSVKDVLLTPENYTVQRLLVDFTTADLLRFDPTLSKMPGLPPGRDAINKFTNMVGDYLALYMAQTTGDHNFLGYTATAINPAAVAPAHAATFPPTAVNFQTYPFLGNGTTAPIQNLDPSTGGLNMLVFDEVCNGRQLPYDYLSMGSGNWVLPGKSGLVAISGDNFWSGYLFKIVEQLAAATDVTATYADAELTSCNFTWQSGRNDKVDYTNYTKDGNWPADETERGYIRSDNSNWDDHTTETGFTSANAYINCDATTRLRFTPGTNKFTIGGTTHTRLYYFFKVLFATGDSHADVWADWHFDCTLQSVLNGGLSITVTSEDPPFTTREDQGGSALDKLTNLSSTFTNDIDASFSKIPWGDMKTYLNDALSSSNKFYFPAGNQFAFKDAFFNANGDVLVNVEPIL